MEDGDPVAAVAAQAAKLLSELRPGSAQPDGHNPGMMQHSSQQGKPCDLSGSSCID